MQIDDKQLIDSLYKKAVGYNVDEEVIEYSADGEILKRKVSTKHIPADITALKAYMEINDNNKKLPTMTDEDLKSRKDRLMRELYYACHQDERKESNK